MSFSPVREQINFTIEQRINVNHAMETVLPALEKSPINVSPVIRVGSYGLTNVLHPSLVNKLNSYSLMFVQHNAHQAIQPMLIGFVYKFNKEAQSLLANTETNT